MKPTPNEVNEALRGIEFADLPDSHPRKLAREAIARWRSNAQREGLPTTNLTDSGAPLLDRDLVLRRSYPDYAPLIIKRSLLSRLFRR